MVSHATGHDFREEEDLVDLRSVWVGLRRRAALFAGVAATTFLAVVLYAFLSQELYTAETSLVIEPKSEVFAFRGGDSLSRLPTDPTLVDTQVELLRSRAMAMRVAEHLRSPVAASSQADASKKGDGFLMDRFASAAARLNSFALKPDAHAPDAASNERSDQTGDAPAAAAEGEQGAFARVDVATPTKATEDNAAATGALEARAAGAEALPPVTNDEIYRLQKRLEVERVGDTFLIKVRYSNSSPEEAARVANAYAEQYIDEQIEAQFSALERANRWIDARIAALRTEVRHAEEAAAQFRAEQGLLDSTAGKSLTEQRITALVSELAKAKSELSTAQARYDSVTAYLNAKAPIESIAEVMGSPVITDLKRQQTEITRRRAELTVRYGARHPEIKKVNEELQELNQQIDREVRRIVESLRTSANFARGQVNALEKDLANIQSELEQNNAASVRLLELERDTQASRGVYEALLNRQKELNERDRLAEANARIVARATPPETPSKPRKKILLGGGLVLAFLIAAGASFGAETLDTRIRNTHDVRKEFGPSAPVVLIPRIQSRLLFRQRQGNEVARKYILEESDSTFAEAMRDLRLHLKSAAGASETGVTVAFTSAFRNEGKTTTAFSFATLLADSGRRVAFVDLATGESEFV
ncbi:MAG: GumC family protein, partial [Amphiplicatus sp.]